METGAILPTSVKERVSDTTNKIMSPSFIDEGTSIGWSYRHIYPRADSELVEEEIKCKHLLCWSGEHGTELFNSWNMFAEEQK